MGDYNLAQLFLGKEGYEMKKGRIAMLCSKKKIRNREVSLFISAAMASGT